MTLTAPVLGRDAELPTGMGASGPAEARGRGRDDVRLLVADRGSGLIRHLRFADIVEVLSPGDLVVVNTSATLPAALPVTRADGTRLLLHLSSRATGGVWLVELRAPAGAGSAPFGAARAGETLWLPGEGRAVLLARPRPPSHPRRPSRLWMAELHLPEDPFAYLARHGRPIRYGHAARPWPIADYQTVFATEAGSAEMPSAGRAFTPELVTDLVRRGIGVAPIVLHAGVSSPEDDEAPSPEYYRVPPATARWVNVTRDAGSRVVAVGTTVVRALETVADHGGHVRPGEGWTDLVVDAAGGVRVVDGLLTGWHEPAASHLALVQAVAGAPLLIRSYREAAEHGYLWHEFGDLLLVLP